LRTSRRRASRPWLRGCRAGADSGATSVALM
jgi:hypothetical protein